MSKEQVGEAEFSFTSTLSPDDLRVKRAKRFKVFKRSKITVILYSNQLDPLVLGDNIVLNRNLNSDSAVAVLSVPCLFLSSSKMLPNCNFCCQSSISEVICYTTSSLQRRYIKVRVFVKNSIYFQALSKRKLKRKISSVTSDMSSIRDVYENDEESHVDKKWKKLLSGKIILNTSTIAWNVCLCFLVEYYTKRNAESWLLCVMRRD